MRYVLGCDKETRAFDSLAQLRYFLSRHIPVKQRKDSEPVDSLCLEQAADGVLLDTRCSCQQWAEHYNLPDEVVFAMVADLFIFERSGAVTLDTKFFVEFAEQIIREEQLTCLNPAEEKVWEHAFDHLSNKGGWRKTHSESLVEHVARKEHRPVQADVDRR